MKHSRLLSALIVLATSVSFAQEKAPEEIKTSGQGDWVFKYRADLSKLPAGAEKRLKRAHGGFAIDRKGKGDIYFHLDGFGIIHIAPDFSSTRLLESEKALRAGNGHNTSIGYDKEGKPFLVIPDNRQQCVFFADTEGKILHRLGKPTVMDWFVEKRFLPTDTLVVDDKVLVADGYGTKFIYPAETFGKWLPGVYGGRKVFTTSHGLDLNPVTGQIAIADREASQIRYYDQKGNHLKKGKKSIVTKLPKGAHPCDIDYMPDGTAIVGSLREGKKTPGNVYILDPTGKIISTIKPKVELGLNSGLNNFQHIHNASWTKVGDKVYLLLYAWNPGGFAVLERVENPETKTDS